MLHNGLFLRTIFSEDPLQTMAQSAQNTAAASFNGFGTLLEELHVKSKALFSLIAPNEYGITPEERVEIGVLTSLPLLRQIVTVLTEARTFGRSSVHLYWTKESHMQSLFHLVCLYPIAVLKYEED